MRRRFPDDRKQRLKAYARRDAIEAGNDKVVELKL